jgi:DNA-binding XRE family transcriptional regulator
MQMDFKSAGEFIVRYRLDNNMSQSEFAKIIGINKSTLGRYEQGLVSQLTPSLKITLDYIGYQYNSQKESKRDSLFNKGSISLDNNFLAFVMHLAIGDRSVDDISTLTGIERDFFIYLLVGKVSKQPTKTVIHRIATIALNNITEDILLFACGYLVNDVDLSQLQAIYDEWKNPSLRRYRTGSR